MAKKKRRGGKGRFRSKRAISAQIGLGSLINRARKDESFRNDPASEESVIKDMPKKFQDNFKGVKNYEDMNEAQKAIFNFYDDGRSEFQRQLNRNIQSNPQFAKAYAERFPKTNLAMKGLPMLFQAAGSAVAPGFGLAAEAFKGAKAKASDIGTTLRESLQPTFDGLKELFTPDLGRGPGPLTRDQNTANIEAMNLAALDVGRDDDDIFSGPAVQTGFNAPTNVSTLPSANRNFERIFALPQGAPPITPGMQGNYLVNDPGGFLRMQNLPVSTTIGEPKQTSSSDFLMNQARTLNTPSLNNEIQLAELNPSQRAVLDQRANRFAFDQGLATPEDMLNKIRPLDKSGIFGFFGNEANLQDIVDFYRNNPTVTMAQGGLASLQDPNYNLLMEASDFSL